MIECCHTMISIMVVTVLVGLELTVIVLLGGIVKGYMVSAKTVFSQVSMRIVLLAMVMMLNLIFVGGEGDSGWC